MRIVSKFHDYYDHAMSYGVESDITYIRKKERVDHTNRSTVGKHDDFLGHIGFAGKIYPFIRYHERVSEWYCNYETRAVYCYNYDQWFEKRGSTDKYSINNDKNRWNALQSQSCPSLNLFEKAPIFAVDSREIEFNPLLREYEFFRVLDPFTAYQNLYMYLSNKARPDKPLPHIDDKTMAEAKGFNKYSFRKDKAKK